MTAAGGDAAHASASETVGQTNDSASFSTAGVGSAAGVLGADFEIAGGHRADERNIDDAVVESAEMDIGVAVRVDRGEGGEVEGRAAVGGWVEVVAKRVVLRICGIEVSLRRLMARPGLPAEPVHNARLERLRAGFDGCKEV